MALIHCDFYSEALKLSTSMCVILPQATQTQIGMKGVSRRRKHPTLYLLHGLSDDHTIWQRRTSIERYVAPLGLAVVMPAVNRSYYTDMASGPRYWTFISDEVPRVARSFFPLSGEREDNFVAGLSMGGYGAFKLALRRPEIFAAAASLSGALDLAASARRVRENDPEMLHMLESIFGDVDSIAGDEHDLFHLAEELVRSGAPIPRLYQCCGAEDFLLDDNRAFRAHAKRLGLEVMYEESPGHHEWGYWDQAIRRVLEWLHL